MGEQSSGVVRIRLISGPTTAERRVDIIQRLSEKARSCGNWKLDVTLEGGLSAYTRTEANSRFLCEAGVETRIHASAGLMTRVR